MRVSKNSKSIKDPFNKYPQIARRLRSLRIDHGMTQDELGETFGISSQAVSSYENGKVLPSLLSIMKYHEYFGIDLNYLLSETKGNDDEEQFIISSTETQIIKGYRRRPEYIKKIVRSLCYAGTSFRSKEEEIKDLEAQIRFLRKDMK